MKKSIILSIITFSIISSSFGSILQNFTFSATGGQFQSTITFDSVPVWNVSGIIGNSPRLSFKGSLSSKISNKIIWGPLSATISSTNSISTITFNFPFIVSTFVQQNGDELTVNFITLGISQTLPLTGPSTKISIDFSGQQTSTLNLAIKYLARILNRNLIVDPSIANNPVNITLKDVTAAEAFYDILISSPGIGYAILPDGTYYIASLNSLLGNFGKLGIGTYDNIVSFYNLSMTNINPQDFTTLINNLFGQNRVIGSIGPYQIVSATVQQQKTISNLMDFLKESESFSTIKWNDPNSVQDLIKLITMMYPNLKITYLNSFSTIVLNGSKGEIQDAFSVISEYQKIVESIGPKVTVSFIVPKPNVQAFIQFSKQFSAITAYGSTTAYSSDAVYLILGPKDQVNQFAQEIGSIASTITQVKPQTFHFNFAQWSDANAFSDLSKIISVMYPDVQMIYLQNFDQILVYGVDTQHVDEVATFIKEKAFLNGSFSSITNVIKIRTQDYQTVKSIIEAKGLTFFGPSKPSTSSTFVAIAISGPAQRVDDVTALLNVSGLAQKEFQTKSASEQSISVNNGMINVDVTDYPLSSLIQKVYASFSKNVVFAEQNFPNITLKLSNVNLDQFNHALSDSYGISFSGSSIVVAEKNTGGVIRVYQANGNINQIQSLATFLGGSVYSDPNTGLVVVKNLTPNSAKELDAMVSPLLNPRKNIIIEAKILDVSENNSVNTNFNTTVMTPQLIFNNGLTLSFNLLNAVNPLQFTSNLANQIMSSNATVTANLSQMTGNGTILSAPTLMTQSGESAQITVGSQYPYLVTTVNNSQTTQQLQFLTTGIQLTILPVVLPNGQISLTITIQVSDADWGHAVNGIPAVSTRNASVKVVVSSGQTIMIGGLTKDNRSENITKIPFLGDLPFIGQFFTSTTFQNSKDNLNIFIRAAVEN